MKGIRMENLEFSDKVALVTGAAGGIGEAIAVSFAQKGAKVVVADIDEENGKSVVEKIIEADGEAIFLKADVADDQAVKQMVEETIAAFGRLDYAVNNAGIGGAQANTGEYAIEDWLQVIDINLNGVFYCMRYEIPQMLDNGGGAIVNISSILGTDAFEKTSAYTASKHGVIGLTKTAALEYAQQGIRVNSVGPAFINTPMVTEGFDDEALEQIMALHAMGRLGEPQEVADMVTFLCSDKASFMTGGYYLVDGGYTAG
jgi:NAD(P)-dependent dehydrogenase (short-subunit alcohol dehydrogenase family)